MSERMMIRLEHVAKTYPGKGSGIHAVKDVSLEIEAGDIYGIVGFSGAGKSTLVRCINMLERPDAGTVTVDGIVLNDMKGKKLNAERKKIGMIFQQFNLYASRTVTDNIAFPLYYTGVSRAKAREKAAELLAYVEMTDKADAYPSQLSGGQKQRVAIARALATDPKILLCDEATSALDPITTSSILRLLKKLNRETGITIVVITHQMQVVKELCHHVAVMESGMVVETGNVFDIFAWPQKEVTRHFVDSAGGLLPEKQKISPEKGKIILTLKFFGNSANDAVISQISRRFNVDLNILSGNIETIDDQPFGRMTVRFSGSRDELKAVLNYLKEIQIEAEVIGDE